MTVKLSKELWQFLNHSEADIRWMADACRELLGLLPNEHYPILSAKNEQKADEAMRFYPAMLSFLCETPVEILRQWEKSGAITQKAVEYCQANTP